MRYLAAFIMAVVMCSGAWAEIRTQTVKYNDENAVLEGYLAYDDSMQGKRPGVLVVHEWWGLNSFAKKRAESLARLGYVAFAIDMYGEGISTSDPQKASQLSSVYIKNRALMRTRAKAGLDVLLRHPLVDANRAVATGYCFGGTTVLELARAHAPVQGVVSFHGGLTTPDPAATRDVKAKVLVLHGADDPFSTKDQINTFMDEMRSSGADWQMIFYGGAVHGFTNPDADSFGIKGVAYNEKADKRSWQAMRQFLDEIFK
ncbi:MAG TPA: dienelactone hydrolase family protein [Dissulfurispiraceae bacterium]|nr:dienelactone hydrolase family protein [Dissulfurispiraceae bacterium]